MSKCYKYKPQKDHLFSLLYHHNNRRPQSNNNSKTLLSLSLSLSLSRSSSSLCLCFFLSCAWSSLSLHTVHVSIATATVVLRSALFFSAALAVDGQNRRRFMATGWVKTLHCKSNALDDVACPSTPSKKPLLPLTSCGNSSHALRDVLLFPKCPPSTTGPAAPAPPPPCLPKKPKTKPKPKPKPRPANPSSSPAPGIVVAPGRSHKFPTLTELPAGHSSRRVVEIIFISSWSSASASSALGNAAAGFPGAIEMLFRVHNPPRTVARFEEYRAFVRSRAARSEDPRCIADGNEMMRFHCGAGAGDGIYDGSLACRWTPEEATAAGLGAKVASGFAGGGIRTFSGSAGAHKSGGGGTGRRAMLVCRVIAGRVRDESDADSEADSVSRGKGELVVFDHRAVLPCFVIIYKV